ncbi:MAG: threonine synthase [Pantoea sp. Brub]|nr:threonine synthase [Pantoea sp. Brub]
MKFYNIKNNKEQINFVQAVQHGLGSQQGLFFPMYLPEFSKSDIKKLLTMDFISRSCLILSQYIGNDIPHDQLFKCVKNAFSFPIHLKKIINNIFCLELFHGPTLAFKDFGSRFMAQILSYTKKSEQKITILTATSGDTGAAVSHAFYGMKNIRVVILYPKGKISLLQEKLFCTLGNNIVTIAIEGDFDVCQQLVKMSFDDITLRKTVFLNSANSINISRLLAQVCYYFEAIANIPVYKRNNLVISIPSGNFGNLTAALFAKSLGLPINKIIAATNINDTIPRFLATGNWNPKKTISTLSSAMDISEPNNWPRIEELFYHKSWNLHDLISNSVSDDCTKIAIKKLAKINYIAEPHTAISWYSLINNLKNNECGIFIATAHPIKFKEIIENILGCTLKINHDLIDYIDRPTLSYNMPANFQLLRNFLLQ